MEYFRISTVGKYLAMRWKIGVTVIWYMRFRLLASWDPYNEMYAEEEAMFMDAYGSII